MDGWIECNAAIQADTCESQLLIETIIESKQIVDDFFFFSSFVHVLTDFKQQIIDDFFFFFIFCPRTD